MPQLILKLIDACNDERTESAELARIISTDASLTSRLMRIAGSAYRSTSLEVDSIGTAVLYLGTETIKNIAISSSVIQVFHLSGRGNGVDLNAFWWHCLMCGTLSRKIAARSGYGNPNEAFLAGLVHDTGKLLFWENFPEEYGEITSGCAGDRKLAAEEKKTFGMTHNELAAWLVKRWEVNPLLADALRYLGEPAERMTLLPDLAKIIYAAHFLTGEHRENLRYKNVCDLVGFSPDEAHELVESVYEEVLRLALSMGISQPGSEACEEDEDYVGRMESGVRDISLLYGTISSFLSANGRDEVLELAARGLGVLFNVSRVFFFLMDEERDLLTGWSPGGDRYKELLKRLNVSFRSGGSLIARALRENKVKESFRAKDDGGSVTSDEQLARLLGIEGMVCLPMTSRKMPVGVIVLGVSEYQLPYLFQNIGLLKTFAGQVATCIYTDILRDKKNAVIQNERLQAISTVTGKIVHEINNPLGIVRNYMKMLSMKLPEKEPVQEELAVISEEMERVSLLVGKLSEFSAPGAGERQPVDIHGLFSGLFEILRKSLLMPRGIEATLDVDADMPVVMTDKNALKQVIINLVKNSAEALKQGGRIQIIARPPIISGKIIVDDNMKIQKMVEIIVRDNGPGIPPHIRKRLFEPWNSSKKGANSGLGLSVVNSIVKGLGGTISCSSREGAGTEFKVVLPV